MKPRSFLISVSKHLAIASVSGNVKVCETVGSTSMCRCTLAFIFPKSKVFWDDVKLEASQQLKASFCGSLKQLEKAQVCAIKSKLWKSFIVCFMV